MLIAAAACASSPKPATKPASAGAARAETTAVAVRAPLASLVGQRVVFLPVHYFRALDTLNLAGGLARPRDYLRTLDAELAFALADRGISSGWVMPEAIARLAKRNPLHAADPYQLAAEPIRPGVRRKDLPLPDPLGSQLRSLAALAEARYLLFPVEMRLENGSAGRGKAILYLALLDARMANVRWAGEVSADADGTPGTPLAAALASQVADLVIPPRSR